MKMNLRMSLAMILGLFAAAGDLSAEPLHRDWVSDQAKWLLHIDLDHLRATQFGGTLCSQVLDKQLEKPLAQLKQSLSIELDPKHIHSLTVYGNYYGKRPGANGVMMIQTSMKPGELLEDLYNRQTNLTKKSEGLLNKIQHEPYPVFALKTDLYLAPQRSGVLLVSKSRALLESGVQVFLGKARSLSATRVFQVFPAVANTFFFLGVAEGFSQEMDSAKNADGESLEKMMSELPPQARLLQMADGGRIALGEKSEKLFLDVALKARNAENATQMQQVIQGIVALISLSKSGDTNFVLPQVQVSTEGEMVTLKADYPVASLMKLVTEKHPDLKLNLDLHSNCPEDIDLETDSTANPGSTK